MAEETMQSKEEIALETPAGKLKIRGSDMLAVAVLTVSICGFTMGYFLWKMHTEEAKENGHQMVAIFKEFAQGQREAVKEQRVLNCLISTDQKDRRRAYDECERIAR